jgi:hypothetical protein
MEALMQIGKTMSHDDRLDYKTLLINGHPYLKASFDEVMKYEFHWPKEGLLAFNISNVIMLLRLGTSEGYLDEGLQMEWLEKVHTILQASYTNYKDFGRDALIGRELYLHYIHKIKGKQSCFQNKMILSLAYYGLWQYNE